MTVNELIKKLEKIEHKNLPVIMWYSRAYNCGDGYYESYSCEEEIESVEKGITESGKEAIFISG